MIIEWSKIPVKSAHRVTIMVARKLRRVRFLLGRAGSGKTFRCLQEIREEAKREPLGPPLILLVPEQATYQMDRALLEGDSLSATLRCQVLSFRRLAHLVLEESLNRRRVLSDVGRQMVVQALLYRYRSEWRFFDTHGIRPGLTAHLSRILHEFRQYRVTPEMLQRVIAQLTSQHGTDWPLVRKLTDLARLAAAYQEFITQHCYDGDDIAVMLRQAIPKTVWLRHARLWVDSFGDFTKQEYELLEALLEVVSEATFSLCLDPQVLELNENSVDTTRLFHRAEETYRRLRQLVPGQTRVEIVRLPQEDFCPRFRTAELAWIEQRMFADLVTTSPVPQAPTDGSGVTAAVNNTAGQQAGSTSVANASFAQMPHETEAISCRDSVTCVHLVEATTRRAEVEYAARTIRRLVMEEGWRYRQIAVIVRELDDYRSLIEAIFPDYGIPFFTDQRRSVRHHPLVEFVRSALRVALDNWRRTDVVRWLRTEFPMTVSERSEVREIVDRLEQYAEEHGLDGAIWRKRQWRIRQPAGDNLPDYLRPEILNRERLRLTEPLQEFCRQVANESNARESRVPKAVPVRKALLALWQMFERLRVAETLERWQEQARQAGRLDEAAEHVQVWENLLELLQEMHLALGDVELSLEELVAVLEAGLDSLTLGIVPPALDEVLIGAIERSRQPELRGVFLLGVNEGVFPRLGQDDPVLSDRDREMLKRQGIELAPTSEARHLQEQYLGYIAFTRASERLWVSYALTDDSNRPLLPSSFVERLLRLFPNLKPQRADTISPASEPSAVITWHELATALAIQGRNRSATRRTLIPSAEMSPATECVWSQLRESCRHHPHLPQVVRMALKAPDYTNEVALPTELAQRLFLTGQQLLLTVSELESYAWCPFQFFASSGLRLRPRQSFRLSRQDLGQLLHHVLQHFLNRYVLEFPLGGDSLKEHSKAKTSAESQTEREQRLLKVLHEVAEAVIRELDDDRFQQTARRKYVWRQACRILSSYVLALDAQLRAGAFIPHRWELPFGHNHPGSAFFSVTLTETGENDPGEPWVLIPRGRVDRIDVVHSPATGSPLEENEQNESLGKEKSQSAAWLRVVDYKLSPSKLYLDRVYYGLDLQLMMYLLVARQLYGEQVGLAGAFYAPLRWPGQTVSERRESSWREWLRGYRLRGVLVTEAASLFDLKSESGWSPYVQLFWKKDGTLGYESNSDTLNGALLQGLAGHVRNQLRQIGLSILQGRIAVQPAFHRNHLPCTLCALASVCRFDRSLDTYRRLPTRNKNEIIQELEGSAS
jgi:ATP-dependent helicase/nuclease subunit B